ncbi:putative serine protease K12H4.7 isoform X1 [Achroia grisella]|uniref:putative serine protease K12H4.7 isoform X1 n=2 Tax=Achroia grisella TaxID=688607 RepID=UPI0027D28D6B|nr:putative serine protease K12H4.7 isoform X1 [Achroia grisella]
MRLFNLLTLFIIFEASYSVLSTKRFRLGRGNGGNLGAPGGYDGEPLPPARWFKQKLDHSTPTNVQLWKQRYYINDTFFDYDNQGPVFLMIGGEGPADPRWMVRGAWIEYAQKFKALCINLEHRYYGESHPTEDLSTKNLQYLSSYQALADLANFITSMNMELRLNKDIKWIAFGGSYPGSLAAWLRLKYPHLVHAAVSSSGPLLAKVNFMEYFEVVVNALREKTGGEECVEQLKLAHYQIVTLIRTNPEIIEKEFKLCKPFSEATTNDMKNFYNSIADDFADLVQYNEDNRIGADKRYLNLTINTVCNMITGEGSDPAYKKVANFNSIILEKTNQTCLDYSYDNMINELRKVSWGSDEARQWTYQTCTEFGFYQTSSGEVEVFGNLFPINFFIKQCQDIFGNKFDQNFITSAAHWTNAYYGALGISVSRVVFVHGSVDPWHALGVTTTETNDTPAIYIHGTAHCANMYPSSDKDSSELVEARVEIEQYLSSWINLP